MDQPSLRPYFQAIYKKQDWGRGSGPGSSPANTIEYRAFLERFVGANRIRTVTDLGCGDWQFSRFINWSKVEYLGLDVVPEIVAQNRLNFSLPNLHFQELTSIDDLPGGDLLLSKEVLQHLPNATIAEYLPAIRKKYRFALLTNGVEPASDANIDISPGGYRPLRLQDAPFNAPGAVVFDYFVHTEENTFFRLGVFLMLGTA